MSLAFLFPGQGSQSPGMLEDFLKREEVVAETFSEASDILGYDLAALIRDNPQDKLNRTEYTQPALLTASVSLLRLWRRRHGTEAEDAAGHSLGEYSALVAADCLAFADAVALVAFRGRVMTEAVPAGEGKMAAILGLDDARVSELCAEASTPTARVWPANFNCPGQVVVAGHAAAVERMLARAEDAGARRTVILPVSAPSHTPLMAPAAAALEERLSGVELRPLRMRVWSNVTAKPLPDEDAVRTSLVRQLVSPVRWTETIRNMRDAGIATAVEMGPGRVLAGLVRRIDRGIRVHPVDTPEGMDAALDRTSGGEG